MLKLFFYLSLFFLSLGQFASVASFGSGKIYIFDIAVPVFAVFGCIYFLYLKKFSIQNHILFFLGFICIALLSLIASPLVLDLADFLIAAFYLYRFTFYLLAAIVVYNMTLNKMLSLKEIIFAFSISAIFISIAGFAQLFLLPDLSVLDPSLGWDPHNHRLVSVFFDPNYVGGYLGLILGTLLFSNNILGRKTNIFFAIILTAFLLTYSRSAYGLFGAMLFVYGIKRSPKILIISLVIACAAFFAIPRIQTRVSGITDPADSAHLRLISWSNSLKIINDNILLGVGFNAYKNAQIDYGFTTSTVENDHSVTGADSSFLLVLATTGLAGFVLFLLGFLLPAFKSSSYIFAVVLGLLLQSQFINAIFYPQILFFWMIILNVNYLFSDNLQK